MINSTFGSHKNHRLHRLHGFFLTTNFPNFTNFSFQCRSGNEGKRMEGVPHSEKSEGFHSAGLPIKTIRKIGYAELKVVVEKKNSRNLNDKQYSIIFHYEKVIFNITLDAVFRFSSICTQS